MPTEHIVRSGECVSSLAFEHGFFWETIWTHSANAALKSARGDPNILKEGDLLVIPDLTIKQESRGSEEKHRFKLKAVPAKLRLRLMKEPEPDEPPPSSASDAEPVASAGGLLASVAGALPGLKPKKKNEFITEDPVAPPERPPEPRAKAPYVLEIDGRTVAQGMTDADGNLECSIPPDAQRGRLIVERGTPDELIVPLNLGHLDPIEEVGGVKQRLGNLSYGCEDRGDGLTPEFVAALRAFQAKFELKVTGEVDNVTRQKLKELHGS